MVPRLGLIASTIALAAALFSLAACARAPHRSPAIGHGYAGPAALKIRSDIPLTSPTVATVKHGDRLDILQKRRRFVRVRTASGAEGWTDEPLLLGEEDMASLRALFARASKLPPQGQATTYSLLNVHTQPSVKSPSFLQIKEKDKVDVVAHQRIPRTEILRKPLITPAPRKPKAPPKKSAAQSKYPVPPMPKPPAPPPNWLELSKTDMTEEEQPDEEDEKPVVTDDWSLVRTRDGLAGWVLTRRLVMAIPDEVAQYAEGKRIVSYFPLGTVDDDGVKKPIWLWTTAVSTPHPWDFDSFRVFIWSLRHHRYETAYIERAVKGYAPVRLLDVDYSGNARSSAETTPARYPGFSVCVEAGDGQRYRREYALLGNVVRYAGEKPCEAPPPPLFEPQTSTITPTAAPVAPEAPRESFGQRFKKRFQAITRNWFHK